MCKKYAYNFQEINDIVKGLLSTIDSDSLAIRCIGEAGVLESLINCSKMIETINLGVHNYLEKKRLFFPRYTKQLKFQHTSILIVRTCYFYLLQI